MDSEYYLKKHLNSEALIKTRPDSFSKFLELGLAVDGSAFYPALEPFYNTGHYPFIRVGDVKNHIDFENCVKVPYEILDKYPTLKHVNIGDIVLTKGGTVGLSGLITQKCCVTRDLIFINSSVLDEYNYVSLYLFLSTEFCYQQLIRSSSQSVQPHLTIGLVRQIDVFNYSLDFKKQVTKIYNQAIEFLNQSKKLFNEAEHILLDGAGLHNYSPDSIAVNTKSFSESFLQTGRLDAEYYQPKFDELEHHLRQTKNFVSLDKELIFNKRGKQPIYTDIDKGIPVLNSKHIRENKIDFTGTRLGISTGAADEVLIKKNDLLINGTGVGTIGRSAVYMKDQPSLPDNHVTILRTRNLDPVFLAVQLNSIIGKLQVEKYYKGSSGQIELYPNDIEKFIVWNPNPKVQLHIRAIIEESDKLRIRSELLLSLAKQAAEIGIRDGEWKAIEYINANQKKII